MSSRDPQYWLSPHAHICMTGDCAVVLDLHRDKYIGIGREHLSVLSASVVGWPAPDGNRDARSSASPLLQQLLATGILTADPRIGKAASPPTICHPIHSAIEADLEWHPVVTARDLVALLSAATHVRALLKWRTIEHVVTRVRRRKQQRSGGGEFDLDAARPIVETFLYCRPIFFASQDECLFDSLVLLELLAHRRLFPDWLFGVSTPPFRAHSWLQAGTRVLNDLPERVAKFTPILVV